MTWETEPYIWLQEDEAEGTDSTKLVQLIADWFSRGPAVFLDPKVMHAVNVHAELVAALQLLFEDWQTLTNQDFNEGNEDVRQLDKQARAALAKAKAEDEPHRCTGCGRIEIDCSRDPCADVLEDRARYASGTGN